MSNLKFDWSRALGEFLIIVVGVLAALAVDEWRGERESRKLESAYLARLQADIKRDVDEFTVEISVMEKKAAFLQSLIDKSTERQFSENPRALMEGKVYSSFRGVLPIVRTTFDIVSNDQLIVIIHHYDEAFNIQPMSH